MTTTTHSDSRSLIRQFITKHFAHCEKFSIYFDWKSLPNEQTSSVRTIYWTSMTRFRRACDVWSVSTQTLGGVLQDSMREIIYYAIGHNVKQLIYGSGTHRQQLRNSSESSVRRWGNEFKSKSWLNADQETIAIWTEFIWCLQTKSRRPTALHGVKLNSQNWIQTISIMTNLRWAFHWPNSRGPHNCSPYTSTYISVPSLQCEICDIRNVFVSISCQNQIVDYEFQHESFAFISPQWRMKRTEWAKMKTSNNYARFRLWLVRMWKKKWFACACLCVCDRTEKYIKKIRNKQNISENRLSNYTNKGNVNRTLLHVYTIYDTHFTQFTEFTLVVNRLCLLSCSRLMLLCCASSQISNTNTYTTNRIAIHWQHPMSITAETLYQHERQLRVTDIECHCGIKVTLNWFPGISSNHPVHLFKHAISWRRFEGIIIQIHLGWAVQYDLYVDHP